MASSTSPQAQGELPYAKELQIATLAVHRASLLTNHVSNYASPTTASPTTPTPHLSKADASPVTIADFGSQALLISAIHHAFPNDTFIGEESSAALRADDELCSKVWELVSSTRLKGSGEEEKERELLGGGLKHVDEMLRIIDLGGEGQANEARAAGVKVNGVQERNKGRCWVLDPVDGTAAFMKGEQYAIALALVVDGVQKVGVLGCPNLSLEQGMVREDLVDRDGMGWIISAVEGQGAWRRKMDATGLGERIRMETTGEAWKTGGLKWIESQTKNRDIKKQSAVAKAIGAEWPGTDIWSMQMKYMALAVGGCDVLVRISPLNYKSHIWDHAGGQLIYTETGGKLTDANGKDFDFGAGRDLDNNWGVVGANPELHARTLEAVRQAIDGS